MFLINLWWFLAFFPLEKRFSVIFDWIMFIIRKSTDINMATNSIRLKLSCIFPIFIWFNPSSSALASYQCLTIALFDFPVDWRQCLLFFFWNACIFVRFCYWMIEQKQLEWEIALQFLRLPLLRQSSGFEYQASKND